MPQSSEFTVQMFALEAGETSHPGLNEGANPPSGLFRENGNLLTADLFRTAVRKRASTFFYQIPRLQIQNSETVRPFQILDHLDRIA
ncbi:hypothetical protein SAMN05216417_11937 [Nitrosospira multiformis]|uniref:Uncharacterized protein n=1 Tax=Nitrosospira multiformis TaxID=1231 RepID=A0A1I7IG78_9PROT|nr:hypothetical protein SAMN05216417_11937 [Nitrosospira multiformis]